MMLEFIECWDRFNRMFYSVFINGEDTYLVCTNDGWVMESPEGYGVTRYTQKELKQILDKLIELNGEE